jgi:SagB-type dehydrogenase family enzyme
MRFFELYEAVLKKSAEDVKPFASTQEWPESWKQVESKCYERFPLLSLPSPLSPNMSLVEAIGKRRSTRTFRGSVSEATLSSMLLYGCGEQMTADVESIPLRTYPSAGKRYPLECYVLLLKAVGSIPRGVYHFDVVHRGIRNIRTSLPDTNVLVKATAESYIEGAVGALLFTWTKSRIEPKYGERAYKLMLIELGCVTENVALLAGALDVGVVHVGTFASDVALPLLGIDGYAESHVHTLFFG